MAEFSRAKSREVDELRRERNAEKAAKQEAMAEMERMVREQEKRESLLLQKMSLLLNAKKAKILELKI